MKLQHPTELVSPRDTLESCPENSQQVVQGLSLHRSGSGSRLGFSRVLGHSQVFQALTLISRPNPVDPSPHTHSVSDMPRAPHRVHGLVLVSGVKLNKHTSFQLGREVGANWTVLSCLPPGTAEGQEGSQPKSSVTSVEKHCTPGWSPLLPTGAGNSRRLPGIHCRRCLWLDP